MNLNIYAYREIKNKQQILDLIDNDSLKQKVESCLDESCKVFEMNITHNLSEMAVEAGFYRALWYLEGFRLRKLNTCQDLLPYIEVGLKELKFNPVKYKNYSEKRNGWGTYEQFVDWLQKLIDNLKLDPTAELNVSR